MDRQAIIDECIEIVLNTPCITDGNVRTCCATLDSAISRLEALKNEVIDLTL